MYHALIRLVLHNQKNLEKVKNISDETAIFYLRKQKGNNKHHHMNKQLLRVSEFDGVCLLNSPFIYHSMRVVMYFVTFLFNN